jgi:hypothetical protein
MGQEDLAFLLQGAFQVQTFFGRELVLASSADPFEDGNLVLVLPGGASWDLLRLDQEVGSNLDNHLGGHRQILVAACTEVVVVAAAAAVVDAADQLRIPHPLLEKKLPLRLLAVLAAVGHPVEEVAFRRKVPQDIVEAWA